MARLTAEETAARLGVKLETVYAYVSRGLLTSSRAGRESTFDAAEVERMARRGRPRRATRRPVFEVEIDTHLTELTPRGPQFRGHDAIHLARTATYEQVAELLWTGRLPDRPAGWEPAPMAEPVDVRQGWPSTIRRFDRVVLAVALAAAADPARGDLRPEAVAATGARLIASAVEALPPFRAGAVPQLVLGDGVVRRGTIAGRLWNRLATSKPQPLMLGVLNAALVLCVDHELAASTFAARVAASVRADPYAVVGAGLGPVAGPLHGRASHLARWLLDDAAEVGAPDALAATLRLHGAYPGFGHALYPDGDPRARALLGFLREAAGASPAMAVADDVVAAARQRAPIEPNIDFAVAAMGSVTGMPPDAGEVLFSVARMAGWLAHALEEYGEAPNRFRPRARYVPA